MNATETLNLNDKLADLTIRCTTWNDMSADQKIVAVCGQEARKYLRTLSVELIARLRRLPAYSTTSEKFFADWTRCDLICRVLIADSEGQ